MKLVLYIDGKKREQVDVPKGNSPGKGMTQEENKKMLTNMLKRIGEASGLDWEIYLVTKSKFCEEVETSESKITRPPAIYSNTTPMGISKGD